MKIDDFFSTVDTTVNKATAAENAAREASVRNAAFLQDVISRLSSLFATYKERLRARGIHVEIQTYPTSVTLAMRYRDSGHRTLQIGGELTTNRIQVRSFFTNDDGKEYRSTDGNTYDSSNWNDGIAESNLQSCIRDFLFYADRHGGLNV